MNKLLKRLNELKQGYLWIYKQSLSDASLDHPEMENKLVKTSWVMHLMLFDLM